MGDSLRKGWRIVVVMNPPHLQERSDTPCWTIQLLPCVSQGIVEDPLTDLLRAGARQLLAQAVEAEVADMLSAHDHLRTEDGRRRLVRHGHGPEREILTGIGPVPVRRAKLRDRGAVDPSARIRFTSAILPAVRTAHPVAGCGSAGALSARHLKR